METYDFWLGGCHGLSMAQLLERVGLGAQPWHFLSMDLVPVGTGLIWHRFRID